MREKGIQAGWPVETLNMMPQEFKNLKEQVLTTESHEKGLDTGRAKEFIASYGLRVSDFHIIDRRKINELQKVFKDHTKLLSPTIASDHGIYIPEIQTALIIRDQKLEEMNGQIFTEGILVHELAHASSEFTEYTIGKNGTRVSRMGFGLRYNKYGSFLEEGFADMLRAEYIDRFTKNEKKEKFRTQLANLNIPISLKKSGLSLGDTADIPFRQKDTLKLPIKYLYLDTEGEPIVNTSSLAAVCIEKLCDKEPELLKILIGGRKNAAGLRTVAKIFDHIKPGLYKTMQNLGYRYESFEEGLAFFDEQIFQTDPLRTRNPK